MIPPIMIAGVPQWIVAPRRDKPAPSQESNFTQAERDHLADLLAMSRPRQEAEDTATRFTGFPRA